MSSKGTPAFYVLAGVNGGGKSTIGGAAFRHFGGDYYNPDEAAKRLLDADPRLSQAEANVAGWREGVRLLKRAIEERLHFAFETTLGGNTITRLLRAAGAAGIDIHIWYIGLSSPELHIARVRSRVRRGGHDIAERDIRRRYEHSRINLISLLPSLAALRVYDNSTEADPVDGHSPSPTLLLEMERGKILNPRDLTRTSSWAKPIVAAAIKLSFK